MKKIFAILFVIYLAMALYPCLAGPVIDTSNRADLPLGAAGQTAITITGGAGPVATVGRIGVGTTAPQAKLDVNGELRAGNTGLACNATTAGAMRFDNSSKKIQFCNGSSWGEVSGGDPSGTLCGWGFIFTDGENQIGCYGGTTKACNGSLVVDGNCNDKCPNGYSLRLLYSDSANAGDGSYTRATCVKN